jgi:hypothetical protein
MIALRAVLILTALTVAVAILAAIGATETMLDFRLESLALTRQPWGLVTLIHAYAAYVVLAVVICLAERSWVWRAFWILPLVPFGALWAAVWLILRLPSVAARLQRPDFPNS